MGEIIPSPTRRGNGETDKGSEFATGLYERRVQSFG